jgi:hypothetical protein
LSVAQQPRSIKSVEGSLTLAGVCGDGSQVSLLDVVRDAVKPGGSLLEQVEDP